MAGLGYRGGMTNQRRRLGLRVCGNAVTFALLISIGVCSGCSNNYATTLVRDSAVVTDVAPPTQRPDGKDDGPAAKPDQSAAADTLQPKADAFQLETALPNPTADAKGTTDGTVKTDSAGATTLGVTCGGACTRTFCQSSGADIDNICVGSQVPSPCVGTPAGMYCTGRCKDDSDCVSSQRAMRCLVDCPSHPEAAGLCWSETDEAFMSLLLCGGIMQKDAGADGPKGDAGTPDTAIWFPEVNLPDLGTEVATCPPGLADGDPCTNMADLCLVGGSTTSPCVCMPQLSGNAWRCI